jgi:hypothetical protein
VGVGPQSQNQERLRDDADPQSALVREPSKVGWIKRSYLTLARTMMVTANHWLPSLGSITATHSLTPIHVWLSFLTRPYETMAVP